jgi:CelD/BcsL family acetyltransferase involved in cellulose biosynthesis
VPLPVRIGARTLFSFRRKLIRVALPLERRWLLPVLPALPRSADGYLVTALRADLLPELHASRPDLRVFVRQSYQRHYASLQLDRDAYLASFSAKSRSTLKRKVRKLAERSGGELDLRSYSRPDEVEEFYRHARAVSATTYQERLLNAGLPDGEGALARMRELAAAGGVRGWLLFLDDRPIAYLYAPAEGDTLIYAYLGYDPDYADLSPGTVLQLEAMQQLMGDPRFRWFDFTEGDGQHKRQFATGSVACVDLLLLRRTAGNLAVGTILTALDAAAGHAKRAVQASGFQRIARVARR